MSKKKDLADTPKVPTSLVAAPEFMSDDMGFGVQALEQFIIPPRIKVIQKSSGSPYEELFDIGDVVVVPQNVQICETEAPFYFVPLFFFPEWCLWNPWLMKGSLPAIRERTTDPNSPMVPKSRDPKLWSIPCPENEEHSCRYVEHMNFVVLLFGPGVNESVQGIPSVLSFSRAEHRVGNKFAGLIKMRKAALFGNVFQAQVGYRTDNPKGSYHGLDISNPALDSGISPFVTDQESYEKYRDIHNQLAAAHADRKVQVDYEDDGAVQEGGDPKEF